MPASLLYQEFDHSIKAAPHPLASYHSQHTQHSSSSSSSAAHQLEDRRAFELALELSLLGLGTDNNNSNCNGSSNGLLSHHNHNHHHQQQHSLTEQSLTTTIANLGTALSNAGGLLGPVQQQQQQHHMAHPLNPLFDSAESRIGAKKSQNTTECVPVPSSEHVAEIVGRQGCKIKALRAKTNTYIKTPVRGEEPVFVVTGRKEDVGAAKREILSAAEHFSQIRAQRKNNPGSVGPAPNAHLPGHVTASVRVPYRVVGLVVGPKGATIKRIQQQTNTYIITPSREKDPVFEVTGLPDDVDTARKEIEAHIAIRTGGLIGAAGEGGGGSGSGSGSIGTPEESGCGSGSSGGSSDGFSNGSPLLLASLESALNGCGAVGGGAFSTAQIDAKALTEAFANYGKTNSFSADLNYCTQNGEGPLSNHSFFGSTTSTSSGVHSAGSSLLSNSPTDSVFVNGGGGGNGGGLLPSNGHLHQQNVQAAAKFTDLYSIFASAGGKATTIPTPCYNDTDSGLGDSPTYGSGGGLISTEGTWSDFSGARSNYVFSTMSGSAGEDSLELHRRSSSLESTSISHSSVSSSSAPSTAAIIL